MFELKTEAFFDSAHFLTDYHGKCENLHGHRWRVEVTIQADDLEQEGTEKDMVMDFSDFKRMVRDHVSKYDHRFLIEDGSLGDATIASLQEEGFDLMILPFRTTAENLARQIFTELTELGLNVSEVEVDETPNNRAVYRP